MRNFHRDYATRRGFTLIELMVSIAVIGILMAIIIPEYAKFDSSTLLESEAYEMATSLREAQVYSLSARTGGGSAALSYGLAFNPATANQKQYVFNSYPRGSDGTITFGSPTALQTFTIDRSMVVHDVCITVSGTERCDPDTLTIAFSRPEYEARYAVTGVTVDVDDIESARVALKSTRGTAVWWVKVGLFGDISVQRGS